MSPLRMALSAVLLLLLAATLTVPYRRGGRPILRIGAGSAATCICALGLALGNLALPFDRLLPEHPWTPQPADGRPDVLLIGDSIAIGYGPSLRAALDDVARVHTLRRYEAQRLHSYLLGALVAPANGGSTHTGLMRLEEWLGDEDRELIVFNCGLHEVPARGAGVPTLTAAELEDALEGCGQRRAAIVSRLRERGARLAFVTTTPVPEGTPYMVPGGERALNARATRLMVGEGVAVIDAHGAVTADIGAFLPPAEIHPHPAGSGRLGALIGAALRPLLADARAP